MTVYVDQMINNLWKLRGKYVKNCHMFSDTSTEELIDFAVKIGLKKQWIQKSRIGWIHFDLVENRRKRAIENGATAITNYETGKMILEFKRKKKKGGFNDML